MVNPLFKVAMKNKIQSGKVMGKDSEKTDNLMPNEEKLLIDIIHGEMKSEYSSCNVNLVTLDEVAKKVKYDS